jgi:hypothetical protein
LLEELKLSKEQHVLFLASEKQALQASFTVDLESLRHSVATQRDQWHEEKLSLISQSDELRVCGRRVIFIHENLSFLTTSISLIWFLFRCVVIFPLVQQKLITLDADLMSTRALLKTTEEELASTRSILSTTQSEAASVRTTLSVSENLLRQSTSEHSTILSQLQLTRYHSIHL